MLQAHALQFSYPKGPQMQLSGHAWRAGVNLIAGDEGVGKTCLLLVLAGELAPHSGHVNYALGDGRTALSPGDVFWQPPRTPLSEALLGTPARDWVLRRAQGYARWSQSDFDRHAEALGLDEHLHKPLVAFSTGSLRKLWMATGWASGAALTLIDEPLAALDKGSERYVQQALGEFASSAQATQRCVIVAHWDQMQGVVWDDVLTLT